jgi:hypothetical protein
LFEVLLEAAHHQEQMQIFVSESANLGEHFPKEVTVTVSWRSRTTAQRYLSSLKNKTALPSTVLSNGRLLG